MRKINAIGKVCLLGDGQVGKTSLIRKFVLDQFSDDYITTVGTKVSKKKLYMEFPDLDGAVDLTLTIWDILGQKEFKSLHNEFVSFCTQHDTLRGEPATLVLSLPRIFEIKWLVYEPLVRKILEGP